MPRKRKKDEPWHPSMIDSGPMQFIKILNIEYHDPEYSTNFYDINVLEEIKTGEIYLQIYRKGEKKVLAVRLLDKNIGISDLYNEIRHCFRNWLTEKAPVWELKHVGNLRVQSPKMYGDYEIRPTRDDNEVKVKPVSSKDRLEDTNMTVQDEPKKKRVRKPKEEISTKVEEPKVNRQPKSTKTVDKPATRRDLKKGETVSTKGSKSPKTTRSRKKPAEPKVTSNNKKSTSTNNKKKTTSTRKKQPAKSKQLF